MIVKKLGGFAQNTSHILIEGENMANVRNRAKPTTKMTKYFVTI